MTDPVEKQMSVLLAELIENARRYGSAEAQGANRVQLALIAHAAEPIRGKIDAILERFTTK